MGEQTAVDHERALAVVREMYALAGELARADEPYFASHGRKLGARLHHIILSQDPAADLGFFDESHR